MEQKEVEDMGPPSDLQTALPTQFTRNSRTRKLLSPLIVLITVIILSVASLVVICVAIVVLTSSASRTGGVETSQGFNAAAVSANVLFEGNQLIFEGGYLDYLHESACHSSEVQ